MVYSSDGAERNALLALAIYAEDNQVLLGAAVLEPHVNIRKLKGIRNKLDICFTDTAEIKISPGTHSVGSETQ